MDYGNTQNNLSCATNIMMFVMKRSESEREWKTALYIKSNQSLTGNERNSSWSIITRALGLGIMLQEIKKDRTDNSCTSVGVRDTAGSVNIVNSWQFQ